MAGGVRLEKAQEWQARLDRFEQANTTVLRFCDREGVSVPSFYQWRRKLAAVASGEMSIAADRGDNRAEAR